MDFRLLEQWLAELMPQEAKSLMHSLVDCVETNPFMQFTVGMNSVFPALKNQDPEIRATSINALITGICLAQAWRHAKPLTETYLQGFLDHQRKARGENVLDFHRERARLR